MANKKLTKHQKRRRSQERKALNIANRKPKQMQPLTKDNLRQELIQRMVGYLEKFPDYAFVTLSVHPQQQKIGVVKIHKTRPVYNPINNTYKSPDAYDLEHRSNFPLLYPGLVIGKNEMAIMGDPYED